MNITYRGQTYHVQSEWEIELLILALNRKGRHAA